MIRRTVNPPTGSARPAVGIDLDLGDDTLPGAGERVPKGLPRCATYPFDLLIRCSIPMSLPAVAERAEPTQTRLSWGRNDRLAAKSTACRNR